MRLFIYLLLICYCCWSTQARAATRHSDEIDHDRKIMDHKDTDHDHADHDEHDHSEEHDHKLNGTDSHSDNHSDEDHHSHEHHTRKMNDSRAKNGTKAGRPIWQPYVYGTISVAVVSLLSLAGVIVIPFIKKKMAYDGVMLTFMALAVGTMTSDALLHLVPETLGLDSHDDDGEESDHHHHGHEEGHEESSHLGKMVCLLGTLYGLYLLELIMHTVAKSMRKPKITQQNGVSSGDIKMVANGEKAESTERKWATDIIGHGHSHGGHGHGSHDEIDGGHTILGLKSVAFVIVLSDAMHNFTDGLAIGAAYSKSSAAGLGVTIAVVCHELPHEIGNFAILLNTGMSLKKALLLNFLSAVTAFAGLYPGIVAGQQEVLARWIFAAVAAGFLYVALVHMLRELQSFGSLPWYLSLILQNLGMLVGFGVIFLLAVYEHDLSGLA